MRKTGFIVALCALALGGCAGKMDAQRGLSEEWRLRSLEENFLNFKEGQREQEERQRDQQRKMLERVRALEESVARLQGGPVLARPVESLSSAPRAPMAAMAPADEATQAAPLAVNKSLYDLGMNNVRAGKSEEGRKQLLEFLDIDPQSALLPNALYWIGESHYQDRNYAQAILSFKDVTRRFSKHHKAAAALYKIGMCYAQMGERDNASLYLRALLKEYPKSEQAPAAKKKLAELGG